MFFPKTHYFIERLHKHSKISKIYQFYTLNHFDKYKYFQRETSNNLITPLPMNKLTLIEKFVKKLQDKCKINSNLIKSPIQQPISISNNYLNINQLQKQCKQENKQTTNVNTLLNLGISQYNKQQKQSTLQKNKQKQQKQQNKQKQQKQQNKQIKQKQPNISKQPNQKNLLLQRFSKKITDYFSKTKQIKQQPQLIKQQHKITISPTSPPNKTQQNPNTLTLQLEQSSNSKSPQQQNIIDKQQKKRQIVSLFLKQSQSMNNQQKKIYLKNKSKQYKFGSSHQLKILIDAYTIVFSVQQDIKKYHQIQSIMDISRSFARFFMIYLQQNISQKKYRLLRLCTIVIKQLKLDNLRPQVWLQKFVTQHKDKLKGIDLTQYDQKKKLNLPLKKYCTSNQHHTATISQNINQKSVKSNHFYQQEHINKQDQDLHKEKFNQQKYHKKIQQKKKKKYNFKKQDKKQHQTIQNTQQQQQSDSQSLQFIKSTNKQKKLSQKRAQKQKLRKTQQKKCKPQQQPQQQPQQYPQQPPFFPPQNPKKLPPSPKYLQPQQKLPHQFSPKSNKKPSSHSSTSKSYPDLFRKKIAAKLDQAFYLNLHHTLKKKSQQLCLQQHILKDFYCEFGNYPLFQNQLSSTQYQPTTISNTNYRNQPYIDLPNQSKNQKTTTAYTYQLQKQSKSPSYHQSYNYDNQLSQSNQNYSTSSKSQQISLSKMQHLSQSKTIQPNNLQNLFKKQIYSQPDTQKPHQFNISNKTDENLSNIFKSNQSTIQKDKNKQLKHNQKIQPQPPKQKQINPFQLLTTKAITYLKTTKNCTDIMIKDQVLTLYKTIPQINKITQQHLYKWLNNFLNKYKDKIIQTKQNLTTNIQPKINIKPIDTNNINTTPISPNKPNPTIIKPPSKIPIPSDPNIYNSSNKGIQTGTSIQINIPSSNPKPLLWKNMQNQQYNLSGERN